MVLASSVCNVNAQNAAKNWIFGHGARVDFNSTSPVATALNTIDTDEGSSSISDSNGNLLFYTDGIKVWDKTNNQMPNGFGLLGHTSSTHSALIVPCSCNKYFIFTTNGAENGYAYGLRYSVVDMTLHGNLGDVMPTAKNVFLFQRAAEKLAGVSDGNSGFWVVAHLMEDNQFFAYHILAGSDCTLDQEATTTKMSAVGSTYLGGTANYGQGQMKISPDGTKLVVAGLDYGNTSFIELFKFDKTTGEISNYGAGGSLVRDANSDMFYGVEFSPDGKKLYATTILQNNKLFQYTILSNSLSAKTLVKDYGGAAGQEYHVGQLQLAPNGKIYIARPKRTNSTTGPMQGENYLDALTTPNTGTGGFLSHAINLASPSQSRIGLPTVVAGGFSCSGSQILDGCCDMFQVSPSLYPQLGQDYRTFEIFNFKQPASPICSVDITMQPIPITLLWNGKKAFQNGATPITNFFPSYQRLPQTGTISAVSPSITSPAVKFDLGLVASIPYNGKTILKVNHCDGTRCILQYEPWIVPKKWTISSGTISGFWTFEIRVLSDEFAEVTLTYKGARSRAELPKDAKGAKWLGVSLQNESAEIYAIDGPTPSDERSKKFSLHASAKTAQAALFEFNGLLSFDSRSEQIGRTINLLIRNKGGARMDPQELLLTLYDEKSNAIISGTPQR
jgi:hypothetical protein